MGTALPRHCHWGLAAWCISQLSPRCCPPGSTSMPMGRSPRPAWCWPKTRQWERQGGLREPQACPAFFSLSLCLPLSLRGSLRITKQLAGWGGSGAGNLRPYLHDKSNRPTAGEAELRACLPPGELFPGTGRPWALQPPHRQKPHCGVCGSCQHLLPAELCGWRALGVPRVSAASVGDRSGSESAPRVALLKTRGVGEVVVGEVS